MSRTRDSDAGGGLPDGRTHGPTRPEWTATPSGIPLPEVFDQDALGTRDPPWNPARDLGEPGAFPFTRGIHPDMYRGRLWTMRQYAGFGAARDSNRRFKLLLAAGQTGLSIAFDLPTQMGRDADHPLAAGEVGRTGVAVSTLDDMRDLLDGIPLERVSTSMTINATAATLLALYVAVADERGVPRAHLAGTVQNDVLKEYIARGTYIHPPAGAMRLATDILTFCRDEVPRWNGVSVSGYHMREAGADAVQELAFTLGNGIAYVEAAARAGLSVDDVGRRLSFFFNAHADLLEEIAKFRAARRLWARIMRDRLGARDPRAMAMRFHCQTAGSTLQASQPLNNVVRTTIEALAAVLGGTQSLHTNAYDEALGLPTESSATLALRTQQILAHETGVGVVADPLGGAYAIEALTLEMETRAAALLGEIDRQGGMVAAIEAGFPQRAIERAAYQQQRDVESGRRAIVGVNMCVAAGERAAGPPPHRHDAHAESGQAERVRAFRARRDQAAAASGIDGVARAAREDRNLVAATLDAVKAGGTLGEIADALRRAFGEHRQP